MLFIWKMYCCQKILIINRGHYLVNGDLGKILRLVIRWGQLLFSEISSTGFVFLLLIFFHKALNQNVDSIIRYYHMQFMWFVIRAWQIYYFLNTLIYCSVAVFHSFHLFQDVFPRYLCLFFKKVIFLSHDHFTMIVTYFLWICWKQF